MSEERERYQDALRVLVAPYPENLQIPALEIAFSIREYVKHLEAERDELRARLKNILMDIVRELTQEAERLGMYDDKEG